MATVYRRFCTAYPFTPCPGVYIGIAPVICHVFFRHANWHTLNEGLVQQPATLGRGTSWTRVVWPVWFQLDWSLSNNSDSRDFLHFNEEPLFLSKQPRNLGKQLSKQPRVGDRHDRKDPSASARHSGRLDVLKCHRLARYHPSDESWLFIWWTQKKIF